MKAVLSHKCPNCSSEVRFDITKKRMTCPHCSSDFSVYSFYTNPAEWSGADEEDIGLFTCENCGGDITAPKKDTTATCPYCDSRLTLAGRLSGKKRPDYILPFEISHDDAVKIFKQHLKEKVLLPDVFNTKAVLTCRRMYLPFFVFSTTVKADYNVWEIIAGEGSHVLGSGQFPFVHMPVDACKKIPNHMTEVIEPFDFKKAMPFSPSYLTDCNAEIYDESSKDCIQIAAKRMAKAIMGFLKKEYKLSKLPVFADETAPDYTNKITNLTFNNTSVKYAFFPVWIMSAKWKNKNYLFVLNGQTGKMVSDLPCDQAKAFKKFLKRFLLVFGIGLLLSVILWVIFL